MSRLNQTNNLNYGNKETHIFTEFGTLAKENTQKEVLDAIKNINLNVGEIVVGDITVESSDTVTHSKLDTLNTTVNTKRLNSTTDSVSVSGTVAISNDIIVVDNINNTDAPYDLLLNGPTLWADSTPLVNPFFADPNGREGWYYDNFSNIANKSNIYWYANPVSGNLQENDMTFAQLSGMYCIITPDYVENGELTVPFMGLYSQPTGTNDFIPTFAHSRWVYQLNATNRSKLRKAETVLLYTGSTRPEVHLNIPAYQLTLFSTNGTALSSEIIAYMTINTNITTSKIGYLLQYTGFLNSAIGFNYEFQFKNSKERVIQNNQYSGSVTVNTITGFATETTQTDIKTNTSRIKSDVALPDAIQVAVKNTVPISGAVTTTIDNATSSIQIYGTYGTNNTKTAIKTDVDGKLEVVGNFSSVIDSATSSILMVGDDYSGASPAVQNPVYVDANGFIATNTVTATHQDIVYGYDEMSATLTYGSGASNWSKVNPVSSDENGWYATYVSGVSSLLWYNNGPYGNNQPSYNYQSEFTFNKLDLWFMILKLYRPLTGTAGSPIMPTIQVYSKPTGTNDYIAGVCHSLWEYTMTAGQALNYGESIVIYSGQVNKIKLNNPEVRRVVYTNTGGGGDRANNEVINHIGFVYNTPNVYQTLVIEAGVFVNQVGLINYYFSNGNSSKADIATIAMKTATDTINTNVATINTSTSSINTKLTGMTYQTNRLQTVSTLVDADGDVATISTPTQSTGTSSIRGLDTQSYINAYNVLTNVYDNLTATLSSPATPSGSYNALDVYARNPKTQVVNYGQTTVNGLSGLNMYQIYPKKIHYTLSGRTESGAGNVIMGGTGSSKLIYDVAFGKASPQAFSAVLTGGSINRIINYHYVDTDGVLKTDGTALLTALNTPVTLSPATMISINKHWMVGSVGANDQVVIRFGTTNTPANTICHTDVDDYNNGVITVPNGYIGYLTNIGQFSPTGCFFNVVKWDVDSYRSVTYPFYNASQQSFTSGHNGSLGGIYTAGESIAFCRVTAMGASIAVGMFVLEPI